MITLKFLGGASVENESGVLTGPVAQRHRIALLALLVCHPRGVRRERLMALLWPDRDTVAGRNLLNQAVHTLRRVLRHDAIRSLNEEIRFEPDVIACDVVEFEDALSAGSPERAVSVYAGPLLDGFSLDSPDFQQWLDGERERLRRAYCGALSALADSEEGQNNFDAAVGWLRRLAGEEPYNGEVTLRLMQALHAAGDRAGALQQARVHTLLVKQEFAAAPDPQVVSLAERLRLETGVAAGSPHSRGTSGQVPEPESSPPAHDSTSPAAEAVLLPRPRDTTLIFAAAAALLIISTFLWAFAARRNTDDLRRIAVLPFANLTGDPRHDNFVAGIHDALISELAQIDMLTVLSRQSVLRYRDTRLRLADIARELGVDAFIEGSISGDPDTVRISIRLVRADPEAHIWAGSRQAPIDRALFMQGEVARDIASALSVRITPEVAARLIRSRPVDADAQSAYLQGLYHLERASYAELMAIPQWLAEHRAAIRYLERAVALDSAWSTAHAKLALAYHWLASSVPEEFEHVYYPKAKQAALRALSLDPAESQAHASLAFILLRYEWDWEGAEQAIERAVDLDPNSHHWMRALLLQSAGRHDEALESFRMAAERNPLSMILQVQIALGYACAGRRLEAIAAARQVHARARLDTHTGEVGDTAWLLSFTAHNYALAGAHEAAISAAEDLLALTDTATAGVALAFAYALGGRREEARALASLLEARSTAAGREWAQSHLHAALGDDVRALDMVREQLAGGRRGLLTTFRCSVVYQLLRDDPRMNEILRPVRFPQQSPRAPGP